MLTRRKLIASSAAGLAAATGLVPRGTAQTIKNQPVRIIVGFPAGGGTDIASRILAERLRGTYASTVLVENKPGASARLGAAMMVVPSGSAFLTYSTARRALAPGLFSTSTVEA